MATRARERLWVVLILGGLTLLALWMNLPRPVQPVSLALGGALGLLLVVLGLAAAAPFDRGAPLLAAWMRSASSRAAPTGRPGIISSSSSGPQRPSTSA